VLKIYLITKKFAPIKKALVLKTKYFYFEYKNRKNLMK